MGAPYLDLELGSRSVTIERRGDGALILTSPEPLGPYPVKITDRLFQTALSDPARVLIAQRAPGGGNWRRVTYGEAAGRVERIAAALLERGLSAERPVAMLSAASIEHALLAFAALHAGIPYASVTPAYSLLSPGLEKLAHVLELLTPGLVFAQDAEPFAHALSAVAPDTEKLAFETGGREGITDFAALEALEAGPEVAEASARVQPGDVAKFLFTSGSTGMPKAVTVTHRMWCADQQMFAQAMPFLAARPPVFVDWLPWHHTSGGNQVIGMTLHLGGSLYIDEGKPTREHMPETVRNLKEITPTACFSAPKGFAELLPFLRADPDFAKRFFSSIAMFFYSGASLPATLLAEMDAASEAAIGRRVPVMSAYGATETAPFALIANWPSARTGLAGLPLPGVTVKLVPLEGKYEVRVKGPIVTPGYWRAPELTAAAFDEEGFLKLGDSLSFVDEARPELGLAFEGRIAEDFKLTTGTWVNVGRLRDDLMREAGLAARDVVVTGENRDHPGALVFLSAQDCNDLVGSDSALGLAGLADHPAIRAHFQGALDRLAARATGSSTAVARLLLMPGEPDAAAGEITDKGSISQRNVLSNRRELIATLYDAPQAAGALLPNA